MNVPQTNLLEFIGAEQTNLLVTMTKCHSDIVDAFPHLDGVYQAPLSYIDTNIKDDHRNTVLSLYLFTHYHLYFSTACHLRCHLSDSLGSTRKAIDATLTAYRLIEEPTSLSLYHDSHRSYQTIKSYIARKIKQDSTKFPLAVQLIELHELCSEYGSHADIGSFIYRVSVEASKEKGKGLFKLNMFQTPDTDNEMRSYLVQTLLAYSQMAKVFSAFIGEVAVGMDAAAWNAKLDKLIQVFASKSAHLDKQIRATSAA